MAVEKSKYNITSLYAWHLPVSQTTFHNLLSQYFRVFRTTKKSEKIIIEITTYDRPERKPSTFSNRIERNLTMEILLLNSHRK